ncbi:MAG: hypothetical protein ACOC53_00660 [Candidatus Saliniplasma sp.]
MKIALGSLLLGILLVLASLGTVMSLISYIQLRTSKVLAIMLVFCVFLVKSSVMTVSRLWYPILSDPVDPIVLIFDICVLAVLFMYSIKE